MEVKRKQEDEENNEESAQNEHPRFRDQTEPCVGIATTGQLPFVNSTRAIASDSLDRTLGKCRKTKMSTPMEKIVAERLHLLTFFPEDVWDMIAEKLDDRDLENLSNSSLFLRELLLPQRVNFMFGSVWEVMGKRYERTLETRADRNQLLGLRLVCRSWNRIFDRVYQRHSLHFELRDGDTSILLKGLIQVNISKDHEHRLMTLEQDRDYYLSTARSPFFARNIAITISNLDTGSFWETALGILRTYGPKIWYCHVAFDDYDDDHESLLFPAEVYSMLRSVLTLVPNLKVLSVDTFHVTQLVELQNLINSNPLPRLDYLQKLVIANTPALLLHELIRRNSHISALEIDRWRDHSDYDIYSSPLPNLSTFFTIFQAERDFIKLTNPQVNWPLIKLHLNLYGVYSHDWQTIFNVLHDKFRNTLTHLKLHIQDLMATNDILKSIYSLDLPNLIHLDLTMTMSFLTSLDFLLPMRDSLTNLRLSIHIWEWDTAEVLRMAEQVEKGNVIKLLSCAKSGLKSNIWDVLLKLQQLKFRFKVCHSGYVMELNGRRQQCQNKTNPL